MAGLRVNRRFSHARTALALAAAACAGACASNPLALGKVDQTSPVAADIAAAQRAPGPYPSFSRIPPVPKDVRPTSAWRASVDETFAIKRQTEAESAALPFALSAGEADAWASAEQAKIPAAEMTPPPADAGDQTEAFAAAERARATPPPPQK